MLSLEEENWQEYCKENTFNVLRSAFNPKLRLSNENLQLRLFAPA